MWTLIFANDAAEAEVEELSQDMRASFERIVGMIRANGLERMHEPYVKHIEGKIWEMRLKDRDGIARSLYMAATGRRVAVLRTFIKKTEKTPRREIEIALQRAKEVK